MTSHTSSPFVLILFATFSAIASALGARGAPSVALHFKGTQSAHTHPLHATEPVTLWCAPDNLQVTIKKATFTRKGDSRPVDAELSEDQKNATYTIPHPIIIDAGQWECVLETQHGKLVYTTHIYARPIAHPHSTETYSLPSAQDNHLRANSLGVQQGETVSIVCPVVGHPIPQVTWKKDNAPLALSDDVQLDGNTLKITSAAPIHAGLYTCDALNEYSIAGRTQKHLLTIDKTLKVKDELSWLVPLVIIVIMFLLLIIIITLCELRRKRLQQRSQQYEAQE